MPEVLDEHGNYGAIVRYTRSEWEAAQKLLRFDQDEEASADG